MNTKVDSNILKYEQNIWDDGNQRYPSMDISGFHHVIKVKDKLLIRLQLKSDFYNILYYIFQLFNNFQPFWFLTIILNYTTIQLLSPPNKIYRIIIYLKTKVNEYTDIHLVFLSFLFNIKNQTIQLYSFCPPLKEFKELF